MKIRIKGNFVRFRLTKTEVEIFCKTGSYEETTSFQQKTFTYALKAKKGIEVLDASFDNDTITMFLSENEQASWASSNRVGFKGTIDLGNGQQLELLLEKDFVCMDEVEEDQSDNYPNPNVKK